MFKILIAVISLITLLTIDQYSKSLVAQALTINQQIDLLPFLSLHYSKNTGIAFSLLEQHSPLWLICGAALIISFICYRLYSSLANNGNADNAGNNERLTTIGYILILAGALGNLCDRVRLGYVIDFIYFHIDNVFRFAIFNLADSFISIGAACIIVNELCKPKLPQQQSKQEHN